MIEENITKRKYYTTQMKSKYQTQKSKEDQKEKVFDIRERTYLFSQRVLDIVAMLPKDNDLESIRKQLIKSGTSIGANTEEGDGSITRRDFINKIAIARKEAKETRFWLRLISGRYIDSKLIEDDIEESQEIIRVLSAIIVSTKTGNKQNETAK